MIGKINEFQKENYENVDLLVVNRQNELLYDSRGPHEDNVLDVIRKEEARPLKVEEVITINAQLYKIHESMKYRYEKGVYKPARSEVDVAKVAIANVRKLIETQPEEKSLLKDNIFKKASGFEM